MKQRQTSRKQVWWTTKGWGGDDCKYTKITDCFQKIVLLALNKAWKWLPLARDLAMVTCADLEMGTSCRLGNDDRMQTWKCLLYADVEMVTTWKHANGYNTQTWKCLHAQTWKWLHVQNKQIVTTHRLGNSYKQRTCKWLPYDDLEMVITCRCRLWNSYFMPRPWMLDKNGYQKLMEMIMAITCTDLEMDTACWPAMKWVELK